MARLVEHDREDASPIATALAASTYSPDASASLTPDHDSRTWPPLVASPVAALAAFVLSAIAFAIPIFALWLTAPQVGPAWDTWPEVAQIAGTAWLAGQGLPVIISGVTVTLLPWGLALIPAVLLYLAGRWASRVAGVTRPSQLIMATISGVIVYGGLALAVTTWIENIATGPGRVLATTAALAFVTFGWGIVRGAAPTASVWGVVPPWIRRVSASAAVAIGVLVIAASIAVGVAFVANAEATHRLLMSLNPDGAGIAALVLLSLGYLPIVIAWAISYVLGMGFTLSSGAVISPFATPSDVSLPVFPLFGAIPEFAPVGAAALPVVGLISGLLAAHTLKRRGARGWQLMGESAAMVALATAILWALLAASSGSLGTGLLVDLGPLIAPTLGVAALLWGVGSFIIVIPSLAADHSVVETDVHAQLQAVGNSMAEFDDMNMQADIDRDAQKGRRNG